MGKDMEVGKGRARGGESWGYCSKPDGLGLCLHRAHSLPFVEHFLCAESITSLSDHLETGRSIPILQRNGRSERVRTFSEVTQPGNGEPRFKPTTPQPCFPLESLTLCLEHSKCSVNGLNHHRVLGSLGSHPLGCGVSLGSAELISLL